MAYTPTEWKNGDVITAEGLNNIEGGIEDALVNNGIFIVNEAKSSALDKTYREIEEAYLSGKLVLIKAFDDYDNPNIKMQRIVMAVNSINYDIWTISIRYVANRYELSPLQYLSNDKDSYPTWD